MQNDRSRRHHYLPRHYLKGFINDNGSFFIYDKKTKSIFTSNPDQFFFENDLNTVILQNKPSDLLEKLYTFTENEFWDVFDRIRKSSYQSPVDLLDKMHLLLFLSMLHWRLPTSTDFVEELLKNFFVDNEVDLPLFLLKDRDGAIAPQEVAKRIREARWFKKISKLLIPFKLSHTPDWSSNLTHWVFSYVRDGKNWYMVGDNPIITDGISDHDPVKFLNRFVFPISGKILLINSGCVLKKELPEEFIIQYNTAVIERSRRFVACPDKNFLEMLVKYHELYVNNKKNGDIINEIFSYLK